MYKNKLKIIIESGIILSDARILESVESINDILDIQYLYVLYIIMNQFKKFFGFSLMTGN